MSFITETFRCLKCGEYINVALGTFGYGMPNGCSCGGAYEYVCAGWHADKDGKFHENEHDAWEKPVHLDSV